MTFGSENLDSAQSFCPLKLLTGFPCAGCGITKSIISLYQLNFIKSIKYHIFGPIVVFFSLFIFFNLIIEVYTQKKYFTIWFQSRKLIYFFGLFLLIYHCTRIILYWQENSWTQIKAVSIWA